MVRTSRIGVGPAIKGLPRIIRHPRILAKLVTLQAEKRLFSLRYPKTNGRAGRIRQASFRITDLCNLRCHTCGQWGESGFLHGLDLKRLKEREVKPARYLEIFKDLIRHRHQPLVYFWGGEPMLYDGLLDLIEEATRLGMPVSIATNGTRVAAAAERLVEAPLFLLQVSLDGPTAEIHNRARPSVGGGNNFKDVQNAFKAVSEARRRSRSGLPFLVSLTTISQANLEHLVDIYEAFRDQVDLFVFYLSWWIDAERAQAHEEDFLGRFGFVPNKHRGWIGGWKSADHRRLDEQLRSLVARSRRLKATPVTILPSILGEDNLKAYYTDHACRFGFDRCISIYQAVEVNSNGDVSPCRDYHDFVVGNIKNATITNLWNSIPYQNFRRSLSDQGLMPGCSRCCGLMGY